MAKKNEKNTDNNVIKEKGSRQTRKTVYSDYDDLFGLPGDRLKKEKKSQEKSADTSAADIGKSNQKKKKSQPAATDTALPANSGSSKKANKAVKTTDNAPAARSSSQTGKKQGGKKSAANSGPDTEKSSGKTVRIIPLGGLGEIGKNMTLFETDSDMVIIDCGLGFPDEEMPGVDLVIPDYTYVREHSDKLRGVLLTHGHEDHIGGIPYLLRDFNVPVYGTALTIGIIRNKLKEHKLAFNPKLNTVKAGDKVSLGDFTAEFIHVNHSIADACAIALSTPAGLIYHSGDFKLDVTPIDEDMMDLTRIGELGRKGVKLLMCESTNSERSGFAPSEKSVGGVLENVFKQNPTKRIVVATFSSNVHRVMQVIDISVRSGRKVAVSGRSMMAVISAAIELGYMAPPADTIIDIADAKKYLPGQITLVTTGSQGEPMSALYRMAFGDHSQVTLGASDVVVLSSSTIPGNEKCIGRIINELTRNGIKVIYDSVYSGIHASGHACSEEIKLLLQLCKPEFYMPIHGEYRHLNANREIALYAGIPADNIVNADLGYVIELSKKSCKAVGTVQSGRTLIDGLGIGDVGKAVLRDRKALAEDGMVILFASVDLASKLVLNPPEVISKGFVYAPESDSLLREVKEIATEEICDVLNSRKKADLDTMRERVRRAVSKFLSQETGREPMVIPFIADL